MTFPHSKQQWRQSHKVRRDTLKLIFLIFGSTKPNMEVSGWLYKTKTTYHSHCLSKYLSLLNGLEWRSKVKCWHLLFIKTVASLKWTGKVISMMRNRRGRWQCFTLFTQNIIILTVASNRSMGINWGAQVWKDKL